MGNKIKGKVKWWSEEKGYGFITPEVGDSDIFVHHSVIEGKGFKSLSEDQWVEFEIEQSSKGPRAIKVSLL